MLYVISKATHIQGRDSFSHHVFFGTTNLRITDQLSTITSSHLFEISLLQVLEIKLMELLKL